MTLLTMRGLAEVEHIRVRVTASAGRVVVTDALIAVAMTEIPTGMATEIKAKRAGTRMVGAGGKMAVEEVAVK